VADAVQYHLRDRALAVVVLASRLVINGAGQALERLASGRGIALERERLCGRVGTAGQRDFGIDLDRLLGRDLAQDQGRRSGRGGDTLV
jgi:hypothetical protein